MFLPGKFCGQSGLAGYSSWGHKQVGHDLATKPQPQQNKSVSCIPDKYVLERRQYPS